MFKYLQFAEWNVLLSMILFFLTLGVFLIAVVRAVFMSKKSSEHMSHLPLEGESNSVPSSHER